MNSLTISPVVHYTNVLFRIVLTLAVAIFFTLYGESISFFDALLYPSFYLAVGGSAVIVFVLINFVHAITVRLDRTLPWNADGVTRLFLQFIFGFAIPCIAAYYLALLYFLAFGVSIRDRDYLQSDYPLVVIFLFVLNCYYYFRYEVLHLRTIIKILSQPASREITTPHYSQTEETRKNPKDELIITFNNRHIQLNVLEDIASFYKANGYWIKTSDDRTYPTNLTLVEVEGRYGVDHFFRINRKALINRNFISGTRKNDQNTLVVELKPPLQLPEENLTITEKRIPFFEDWLQKQL